MAELVSYLTLPLIGCNASYCPLIGREPGDSLHIDKAPPNIVTSVTLNSLQTHPSLSG